MSGAILPRSQIYSHCFYWYLIEMINNLPELGGRELLWITSIRAYSRFVSRACILTFILLSSQKIKKVWNYGKLAFWFVGEGAGAWED